MQLQPGQRVDRYALEQLLGESSGGRVFRAFDPHLARHVELKVLEGEGALAALRDARVIAAIAHPNIAVVHEAGEAEGVSFVVTELIPGEIMRARLAGAPLLATRIRWLIDIASALGAAHQRGVVHREVRPESVIVRDDGVVKVRGFGMTRRAASAYASPEQLRGETIDGRADQYGWGVLAYEVLTGRLPLGRDPVPPSAIAPEISPAVDAVILRALASDPDARYATMAAAAADLMPHLRGSRTMRAVTPTDGPSLRRSEPPPPLRRSTPPPPPLPAFRDPDFAAPVDLDAHLALLPPGATCKGLFFIDLIQRASPVLSAADLARLALVPERRYVPFYDYPLAENMRISVAAVQAIFPRQPVGEGLRRLGQTAFDTVLAAPMGRALFGFLGTNVERIFLAAPRAYELFLACGQVTSEKAGPRTFLFRARDYPDFLETYQVGLIEGVLRHCHERGRVRVALEDLANATIEVTLR
jgi:serine/threonine-protein kinase